MESVQNVLLLFLGAALVFGLFVAVRYHGVAGTARGLAAQVGSIRAFDIAGTGVRLIGIGPGPAPGQSVATYWVTAFFVPVFPLGRRVVRFIDPGASDARWQTFETTPRVGREVARTVLYGWILFPALLIAPFVSGSVIYTVTQQFTGRELGDVIRTAGVLLAAVPTLLGVPWFGVVLVRLLRWDEKRKRPPARAG